MQSIFIVKRCLQTTKNLKALSIIIGYKIRETKKCFIIAFNDSEIRLKKSLVEYVWDPTDKYSLTFILDKYYNKVFDEIYGDKHELKQTIANNDTISA